MSISVRFTRRQSGQATTALRRVAVARRTQFARLLRQSAWKTWSQSSACASPPPICDRQIMHCPWFAGGGGAALAAGGGGASSDDSSEED